MNMAGTSVLSPAAGLDAQLKCLYIIPLTSQLPWGKYHYPFIMQVWDPGHSPLAKAQEQKEKKLHSNQARLTLQSKYLTLQPCPLLTGPWGQSGIRRLVCINAAQKRPQIPRYLFR